MGWGRAELSECSLTRPAPCLAVMARTISLALALCLLALGAQAALLDHRNPEALVSAGR